MDLFNRFIEIAQTNAYIHLHPFWLEIFSFSALCVCSCADNALLKKTLIKFSYPLGIVQMSLGNVESVSNWKVRLMGTL